MWRGTAIPCREREGIKCPSSDRAANKIAARPFIVNNAFDCPVSTMNLEPQQNEAMRREIGYRLGVRLSREQGNMPARLLQLICRLGNADRDAFDENRLDPQASIGRLNAWLRAVFIQQRQHLRERLRYESNRHERGDLEQLVSKIDKTLSEELERPARK